MRMAIAIGEPDRVVVADEREQEDRSDSRSARRAAGSGRRGRGRPDTAAMSAAFGWRRVEAGPGWPDEDAASAGRSEDADQRDEEQRHADPGCDGDERSRPARPKLRRRIAGDENRDEPAPELGRPAADELLEPMEGVCVTRRKGTSARPLCRRAGGRHTQGLTAVPASSRRTPAGRRRSWLPAAMTARGRAPTVACVPRMGRGESRRSLVDALIRLDEVTKRYDDDSRPALDRVSLEIARARPSRSWARRAAASRRC